MELNNNDAAVCTDSINAQAGTTSAGEIDLYDELIAFAELSPEEQLRLVGRAEQASKETETPSAEEAEEQLRLVGRPEKPSAETEKTSAEEAEEQAFPEPVLTPSPIESVEEAATEDSEAFVESSLVRPELFQLPRPLEPVEAETTAHRAESESDPEVLKGQVEPSEVRTPLVEGPRPSGPLSGFNLPPNLVYTGALSPGVCLTCGADSAADDLFCITCGVFMDEVGSTLSVNPTCAECNQGIAADEIFCPWCGSVLPA